MILILRIKNLPWSTFRVLILLSLFLTACTTQTHEVREYADPNLIAKPHTLLPGEQILLSVFGQSDLTATYRIDDSGYINMPLLGTVATTNKTVKEMADYTAYLLSLKYIRNPSVSVEVVSYSPIYIIGAIKSAGQFTFTPGMTAEAAIASAGGYLKGADKTQVKITRRHNGKVFEANVALQTPLAAGDIVRIYGNAEAEQ